MKIFSDYQFPVVACFFLFFAMVLYWISLSFPKNKFIFQLSRGLILLSNILFMTTLALRWIVQGYFPLSNLYESLIFLSWGISLIHLIIESKTKSRLIGAISTPLIFLLAGFSSLTLPIEMQKALPLVPSLQSNWLMMHVSMMMISYATLIIGSLFSILYLAFVMFNQIIEKDNITSTEKAMEKFTLKFSEIQSIETNSTSQTRLTPVKNFPISFDANFSAKQSLLETIDIWSYRIIGLGFPFLTLGIISGAVWANEAWGAYWSWDPKETWALITWLVFAIYLHSRLLKGWQGQKAAILGSCGFFVIWICYLGVNFLGKGLHSYGWVL